MSGQEIPTYRFRQQCHRSYCLVSNAVVCVFSRFMEVYLFCRVSKSSPVEHLKFCQENMGAVLYPHSVLHLPSSSSLSRPKFRNPNPLLPVKELADGHLFSSVKADGHGGRRAKNPSARAPKAEGLEDDPQSVDDGSSLSPNKEKILALFKRIQASISEGGAVSSKKRNSKIVDDKASSETLFEVLHQSRTQGKGKTSAKKVSKTPASRKGPSVKEERAVHSPTVSSESMRPRSSFTRKSPIPTILSPGSESEQENDALPVTTTPSISEVEVLQAPEVLPTPNDSNVEEFSEFKEMNLTRLKEVAKSKGIRGYSKLKKSELIELLTRSLNNTS